jgi:hypothetical protein
VFAFLSLFVGSNQHQIVGGMGTGVAEELQTRRGRRSRPVNDCAATIARPSSLCESVRAIDAIPAPRQRRDYAGSLAPSTSSGSIGSTNH